jgi:protein-disulfide isomerase
MHWKRSLLLGVALLFGGAVLVFYWRVARTSVGPRPLASAAESPVRHLDAPEVTVADPQRGPKDAKIVIIEFGDYICPFCKAGGAAVDQLQAAYPAEVRFVWKNDPSPLHPGADVAAEAAMCAGRQGAFWPYHQKLFENQETYDETALAITANTLGLDAATFGSCLSAHDTKPLVDRTVDEGKALGVTALPTFFINGKRIEGAMTYDELLQEVGK